MPAPKHARRPPIEVKHYEPPSGYGLDIEVYPGPELRRRGRDQVRRPERADFHILLYLTRRGYAHMVDFESIACGVGSAVIIQPGQVHRFSELNRFHGWLLLFRSELLPPSLGREGAPDVALSVQLEALASHVQVPRSERGAITESLERIAADAKRPASHTLNALLNSQLHTVLLRLCMIGQSSSRSDRVDRGVLERFKRYRALVEREHHRWHNVARYAKQLGCSEKSLARASREVVDMSAKELITNRVVLEARRLLAHSLTPVALISDELGFSEPTNFVKFFRRETGRTPGAFRREHASELR